MLVVYAMSDLLSYLQVEGHDLLLRDYGRRAFSVLEERLMAVSPGGTLALDLRGIRVMDTSFADETIVELAVSLLANKYGDRFLILQEPSAATIENIEGTILRRKVKVALPVMTGSGTELIGMVEPNLADAWGLTQQARTLTARQLADQLGLEINTASMRLHKLYRLRLLAREEEVTGAGRQHIYRLPA